MENKDKVDCDEESLCEGAFPEQITLGVISKLSQNPKDFQIQKYLKKKRIKPDNTEKEKHEKNKKKKFKKLKKPKSNKNNNK